MAFETDVDVDPIFPVGTRLELNGKAWIYAKGVASCVAGSWVSFDENYVTTLLAANAKGRVGIAMAAINTTSLYGWYQVFGKAVGKVLAAFADNGIPFGTSTAGSVDDAVVSGDLVLNAIGRSAIDTPVTGQAYFELNNPSVNDTLG